MEKEMAEIKEEENEARITMNCTQHFEDFVRCNSPRGQLFHVYRFGSFRKCEEEFDQFKFCLDLKTKKTEEANRLYEEREKQKAEKMAHLPQVWQMRTSPPPNFPPKEPRFQ